jgi:aminoglycoside 3-N-acetyltransferase
MHKRSTLTAQLKALGLAQGDLVMVHAALRTVGPIFGGPDALIDALQDTVGPKGTIAAYLDWDAPWEDLVDSRGATQAAWRSEVVPFDPARTRAARENGAFAEMLRTMPGARRSANPGASMAALGAKADWLTADHPQNYGYGPGTPLARIVEADGKVLMLGAPLDTMTLMHHAEHLAQIPNKRIERKEVPFHSDNGTIWHWIEEYDTADPVSEQLPEDFIAQIVMAHEETGRARRGQVGNASCLLVDAADILSFAVSWIEARAG